MGHRPGNTRHILLLAAAGSFQFLLKPVNQLIELLRGFYRIIRLPVRLLHRMEIPRRPVKPYGGDAIPICPRNILFQIVADHYNKRLIRLGQPHFIHCRIKHTDMRFFMSHHLGYNPLFKAVAASVFTVYILEGFPLPVRHQGNSVALVVQAF